MRPGSIAALPRPLGAETQEVVGEELSMNERKTSTGLCGPLSLYHVTILFG